MEEASTQLSKEEIQKQEFWAGFKWDSDKRVTYIVQRMKFTEAKLDALIAEKGVAGLNEYEGALLERRILDTILYGPGAEMGRRRKAQEEGIPYVHPLLPH